MHADDSSPSEEVKQVEWITIDELRRMLLGPPPGHPLACNYCDGHGQVNDPDTLGALPCPRCSASR